MAAPGRISAGDIPAGDWYETIGFADGVTLIHEPWMPPFYCCNMWHIRGRDRDLLIDAGMGVFPLRALVPLLAGRPLTLLLSHTHFDHIGAAHEFEDRLVHPAEAAILADPQPDAILYGKYADGARDAEMFHTRPEGWNAAAHRYRPAPATGFVEDGNTIDLGDRVLRAIHTPGHSPGHLALFEERTGILFPQDAVYDGPLVDTLYHSDIRLYRATMRRLAGVDPSIVHAGHYPSFGSVRLKQLVAEYLAKTEGAAAD